MCGELPKLGQRVCVTINLCHYKLVSVLFWGCLCVKFCMKLNYCVYTVYTLY